jgi:hypothetical protein
MEFKQCKAAPGDLYRPCLQEARICPVEHDTFSDAATGWVPYAWIEALDQEWLFIATDSSVAAFRRSDLPVHWSERFRSPAGNLVLAQEIDTHGSPGDTPLDRVSRLNWPLDAVAPLPSIPARTRGDGVLR